MAQALDPQELYYQFRGAILTSDLASFRRLLARAGNLLQFEQQRPPHDTLLNLAISEVQPEMVQDFLNSTYAGSALPDRCLERVCSFFGRTGQVEQGEERAAITSMLLSRGAKVLPTTTLTTTSSFFSSSITNACSGALPSVLKLLLDAAKKQDPSLDISQVLNSPEKDSTCRTPLHFAAYSQSLTGSRKGGQLSAASCLQLLLENGADPLARDRYGRIALHYAAQSGCGSGILVLLRFSPAHYIDTMDQSGLTPLHLACGARHGRTVRLLLSLGAHPDYRCGEYGVRPMDMIQEIRGLPRGVSPDEEKEVVDDEKYSSFEQQMPPEAVFSRYVPPLQCICANLIALQDIPLPPTLAESLRSFLLLHGAPSTLLQRHQWAYHQLDSNHEDLRGHHSSRVAEEYREKKLPSEEAWEAGIVADGSRQVKMEQHRKWMEEKCRRRPR